MKWHLDRSALATSALLCLLSSFGTLALAQDSAKPHTPSPSPAASQEEQKAEVALKAGYKDFLFGQGMVDEQYLDAVKAGKTPSVPRASYAKGIHTTEDEEETIHSIIFTAYKGMRANSAQYEHDMNSLSGKGYSPEDVAKMDALAKRRSEKEAAIVDQAMAQLRDALPEEDFKRLDWYVRTLERVGK